MSWETTIARRIFPKDQSYMARRKLCYAFWVLVMSALGAGIVVAVAVLNNSQRG
jgi:hypothetical protein